MAKKICVSVGSVELRPCARPKSTRRMPVKRAASSEQLPTNVGDRSISNKVCDERSAKLKESVVETEEKVKVEQRE